MNYVTAYFWQPKNNACSLLLQQAKYRTGQTAVLACICGKSERQGNGHTAGVYLTECLRDLFYREILQGKGKPERKIRVMGRKLLKVISQNVPICGILCLDHFFCMFAGNGEIWMHNTRFGKAHTERICGRTRGFKLQYGILEAGVGLLFGSEGFWQNADAKQVRECLVVEEIKENDGAGRHLGELCAEVCANGAANVAAVLLVSKEEESEGM